jgi:hypothetical protein
MAPGAGRPRSRLIAMAAAGTLEPAPGPLAVPAGADAR